MLRWLFPYNVDDKHKLLKQKRAHESLKWFLEDDKFKKWVSGRVDNSADARENILYCHGSSMSHLI